MIEYALLSRNEIDQVKSFIEPDVYDGFFQKDYRYALCAIEEKKLCGLMVFDATKVIDVLSVSVIEDDEESIQNGLLEGLIDVAVNLEAEAVSVDVYDATSSIEWQVKLLTEGFVEVEKRVLYRFSLDDLEESRIIKKAKDREGIVPLLMASERQRRAFSNVLIQKKLFDRFLSEDISEDLSMLYIKDGWIVGCVLVSIIGDHRFNIEYVYMDNGAGAGKVPAVLSATTDRLMDYYGEEGADGFILSTNDRTDDMIHKVLPDPAMMDCIRTYICMM